MGYELYKFLKDAYDATTRKINRFKKAVESVEWDSAFEADGEIYFRKGDLTLTIENINPFEEAWKPDAIFSDGTVLTF